MAISIGGTTPSIQPAAVEWEPRQALDISGEGQPLFGPLRTCRLMLPDMSRDQFEEWHDLWTTAAQTVVLPSEEDGTETSYTTAYVLLVRGRQEDLNVYDVEVVITNINDPL